MCALYSVSLCSSVYCLCVNVHLEMPPGLNPTAVKEIYQYMNKTDTSPEGLHAFMNTLPVHIVFNILPRENQRKS